MTDHEPLVGLLVSQIVERVHLFRVVLFGSRARNEANPDSDIDLLIVMPEGTHRRKTAHLLYRKISGVKIADDLVVPTPSDLERHEGRSGLVYEHAIGEGCDLCVA